NRIRGAGVRIDPRWHVDRDHLRRGEALSRRLESEEYLAGDTLHGTLCGPHSNAENGIDDERSLPEQAVQALEVGVVLRARRLDASLAKGDPLGVVLPASPREVHRDRGAPLGEFSRGNQAVATVVARPAEHEDGS